MQAPSARGGRSHLGLGIVLGLLVGCSDSDLPDDDIQAVHAPEIVRIVPAGEAIAGAHLPTLDPGTMNEAEIRKALGDGPRCEFGYMSTGRPVLAMKALPAGGAGDGVVKLNGHLVVLAPTPAGEALHLHADPIRLTLTPARGAEADEGDAREQQPADLILEIGSGLTAGYRGFYRCP